MFLAASSVALLCALAPGVANAAGPDPTQSVFLDAGAGSVTTPRAIPAGKYAVRIDGTFSTYDASLWNQPTGSYNTTCGATESAPKYASLSQTGAVGSDVLYDFAHLARKGCGSDTGTTASTKFKWAFDGNAAAPPPAYVLMNAAHAYKFIVTTTTVSPATFSITDPNLADNYGQLKITISPA